MESRLLDYDQKIRVALSVQNPRKEDARGYLDAMLNLVVSGLMLKKNPHVVDAVKKVSYSYLCVNFSRRHFGMNFFLVPVRFFFTANCPMVKNPRATFIVTRNSSVRN